MMIVQKKVQVVVIAQNEALLLKTNEQRGLFWQNVTGGVDDGEEVEKAAIRECQEELGLEIKEELLKIDYEFNYTHPNRGEFKEYCFLLNLDSKFQPILDPKEHVDFRWVALDNIRSDNFKYQSNFQAFLAARNLLR